MMNGMNEFKLVLIGEAKVGKSTLMGCHLFGEFQKNYEPTLGVDVNPLSFKTDHGEIRFMVWDTAGQEQFGGLRDGYYIQAHCAIMMFDVTSQNSYDRLEKWHRDLVRVCGNIPIVICGNKVDLRQTLFNAESFVKIYRQKQLMYFEISAKSNYNLDKPFLYLARQLLGDQKQELAKHPSFPKLIMTAEQLSQLQEDLNAAKACDLPAESDDDL